MRLSGEAVFGNNPPLQEESMSTKPTTDAQKESVDREAKAREEAEQKANRTRESQKRQKEQDKQEAEQKKFFSDLWKRKHKKRKKKRRKRKGLGDVVDDANYRNFWLKSSDNLAERARRAKLNVMAKDVNLTDKKGNKIDLSDPKATWEAAGDLAGKYKGVPSKDWPPEEQKKMKVLLTAWASNTEMKTPKDGVHLWTGGGTVAGAAADKIAKDSGVSGAGRLESTDAGKQLEKFCNDNKIDFGSCSMPAWETISSRIARSSTGKVTTVTAPPISDDAISRRIELPIVRARQAMGAVSDVQYKTVKPAKVVNEKGQPVDSSGRILNDQNQVVNEKGEVQLDGQGKPVTSRPAITFYGEPTTSTAKEALKAMDRVDAGAAASKTPYTAQQTKTPQKK